MWRTLAEQIGLTSSTYSRIPAHTIFFLYYTSSHNIVNCRTKCYYDCRTKLYDCNISAPAVWCSKMNEPMRVILDVLDSANQLSNYPKAVVAWLVWKLRRNSICWLQSHLFLGDEAFNTFICIACRCQLTSVSPSDSRSDQGVRQAGLWEKTPPGHQPHRFQIDLNMKVIRRVETVCDPCRVHISPTRILGILQ